MNPSEQSILCTEEFFKDTFGIDEYLSKCTQKSELLTLRRNLQDYGSMVYSTMVDILKMQTEDIINLAESLTNLGSKIDELSAPVSQLCEEIRTLHHNIKDAKQYFDTHLNKILLIHSETDRINLKMGILSSSMYINSILNSSLQEDVMILERSINEFSFHYLYLQEINLDSKVIDKDIMNTVARLLELVHNVLLKALRENDEETILRSLRMYVNLNKQNEAEKLIKEKIVCPALNAIFTQKNLDIYGQNVKILYDRAIDFLNSNMKPLLTVLNGNPDTKGFNFVINSFWIEADKQLCDNLPNITAPGNPELFQKRYQDTWLFLQQIINIANDPALFKNDPSFQAHMKRFNLPVYFEIRFQQIAAQLEAEMVLDPAVYTEADIIKRKSKNDLFTLKVSLVLWKCIQRCFHDEVFLIPLTDQFLKLKMLLISRYLTWLNSHLDKWNMSLSNPGVHKIENFIIYALIDMDTFKNLIGFTVKDTSEFDKTIFKIIPSKVRPPLQDILNINWQMLDSTCLKLQKQLVSFKVQQSVICLQQVTSIPRLYRRTNRTVPKEPSNYVIEAVSPIIKLYNSYDKVMGDKIMVVMDLIIASLSEQYVSLVQEVLLSVCKTEESLRRLKSRNLTISDDSVTHTSADATSDETKIREQIKLDVGHFIKKLRPFVLDVGKKPLTKLIDESGY